MTLLMNGTLVAGALAFGVSITASAATPDRRCLKVCGKYEVSFMMETNFLREEIDLSCDIKGTEDDSHDYQRADSGIDGILFLPSHAGGICSAQVGIGGSKFTAVLKSSTEHGHFVLQTDSPGSEVIVFRKVRGDRSNQPSPTQAIPFNAAIAGITSAGAGACADGVVHVAVYSGHAVVQQSSLNIGLPFSFQVAPGSYAVAAQTSAGCGSQELVTVGPGQTGSVNLNLIRNGAHVWNPTTTITQYPNRNEYPSGYYPYNPYYGITAAPDRAPAVTFPYVYMYGAQGNGYYYWNYNSYVGPCVVISGSWSCSDRSW
jgi:hypothetical protein